MLVGTGDYYIHLLYAFDDSVEENRKMAHFSLLEETTKRNGDFLLSTNVFCLYYWNRFFGTIFQGVGDNCGYVYTSQLVKFCVIYSILPSFKGP